MTIHGGHVHVALVCRVPADAVAVRRAGPNKLAHSMCLWTSDGQNSKTKSRAYTRKYPAAQSLSLHGLLPAPVPIPGGELEKRTCSCAFGAKRGGEGRWKEGLRGLVAAGPVCAGLVRRPTCVCENGGGGGAIDGIPFALPNSLITWGQFGHWSPPVPERPRRALLPGPPQARSLGQQGRRTPRFWYVVQSSSSRVCSVEKKGRSSSVSSSSERAKLKNRRARPYCGAPRPAQATQRGTKWAAPPPPLLSRGTDPPSGAGGPELSSRL